MKRYSLKSVPFATARDDGEGILFRFDTHSGNTFEFECPPNAVPQILARMMSALEQASKIKNPSRPAHVEGIRTLRFETGLLEIERLVVATFYAAENAGISFVLDASQAQQLSSQLAAESARAFPITDPKSLS